MKNLIIIGFALLSLKSFACNEEIRNHLIVEQGMTKDEACREIQAFKNQISVEIANSNEARVLGFGRFKVEHHESRFLPHPTTGQLIFAPARTTLKFVAERALKDSLNGKISENNSEPLNSILIKITDLLKKYNHVSLSGIGSFKSTYSSHYNHTSISFSAARVLRESVAK